MHVHVCFIQLQSKSTGDGGQGGATPCCSATQLQDIKDTANSMKHCSVMGVFQHRGWVDPRTMEHVAISYHNLLTLIPLCHTNTIPAKLQFRGTLYMRPGLAFSTAMDVSPGLVAKSDTASTRFVGNAPAVNGRGVSACTSGTDGKLAGVSAGSDGGTGLDITLLSKGGVVPLLFDWTGESLVQSRVLAISYESSEVPMRMNRAEVLCRR